VRHGTRNLPIVLVSLACASSAYAAPTVDEAARACGILAEDIPKMKAGKLVQLGPHESSDRDLSVGFAFIVKAPASKIADAFRRGADFAEDENIVGSGAIDPAAPLAGLAKMKLGGDEWKHLVQPSPGTSFNLSAEEIARFRALGGGATEDQVNALLREVLAQRLTRYVAHGLAGIAPYAREQGATKPADDVRGVLSNAWPVLDRFAPGFKHAIEDYPKSRAPGLRESFHWVLYELDGRRTVTLRHRMTLSLADGEVALDRELYVSQGYDAMQAVAGLFSVKGGALVFYRAHTFTDRVAGISSSLKHSVGRRMMANQLEKIFERGRERAKDEQ
jgi:hypothetical protein